MPRTKSDRSEMTLPMARLFAIPKLDEPTTEDGRREYAAAASATFRSKPFNVMVVQMRDELVKLAVVHDRNTESGDWVRGATYCLDQLVQRYEMLDAESREPKEEANQPNQ